MRKLCKYKGIEIIEAKACSDHIHMCLAIPPKYSVANIIGYLFRKIPPGIPGNKVGMSVTLQVKLIGGFAGCKDFLPDPKNEPSLEEEAGQYITSHGYP